MTIKLIFKEGIVQQIEMPGGPAPRIRIPAFQSPKDLDDFLQKGIMDAGELMMFEFVNWDHGDNLAYYRQIDPPKPSAPGGR